MKSPLLPAEDRALYDHCCEMACRQEHRDVSDSHVMAYGFSGHGLHWRWMARAAASRLSLAALAFACVPSAPILLVLAGAAALAERGAKAAGRPRWESKAFAAGRSLRRLPRAARDLFEGLAFLGDPMARGSLAYDRLACFWTRSLCEPELPAHWTPNLDVGSAARSDILDDLRQALASDWAGPAHWASALSRASMIPEDFDAADRHWQASGLSAEWAPSAALPSYGALRLACARLGAEHGPAFEAQERRAQADRAARERADLDEEAPMAASPARPRRL